MFYETDPDQPYGPVWKKTLPLGLPANYRACSTSADGERILRAHLAHDNPDLAAICLQLASTESECMIGRAADRFDVRGIRPKGKPYVSAAGVYQFNKGCLDAVLRSHRARGLVYEAPGSKIISRGTMPHELSPELEIEIPLNQYRFIWDEPDGWPASYRARAVRLWHISPVLHKRLKSDAARFGVAIAWAGLVREWEASDTEWVRSVPGTINRRIKRLKFSDGSK